MRGRQLTKQKKNLKLNGINFNLKLKALKRFINLYWYSSPPTNLISIIDILKWGVGFIPCSVFSQIEKDDDLAKNI
jgi:hypothetical protein